MDRCWRRSCAFIAGGLLTLGAICTGFEMPPKAFANCRLPEVWLAPLDAKANQRHFGVSDFAALFQTDWSKDKFLSTVRVLKFYPSYLEYTPDEQLKAALGFLAARNVRVALESSMLMPQDTCGAHFAGDSGAETIKILTRIKKLGGVVHYLAMNEPFLHGYRNRALICSTSVPEFVAANAAATIKAASAIFPDIEVGDIEAIGGDERMKPYLDQFPAWIQAFHQITKKELSFFHLDIDWAREPWKPATEAVASVLKANRIKFGLIYNGADTDSSAGTWAMHARQHYQELEQSLSPDAVIFQSWAKYPSRVFPETDENSFEGMLKAYVEWRAGRC